MSKPHDYTSTENRVAIIGMACRLPGAANVGEFWANLQRGAESLTTFKDDELLASGVAPALVRSPNYVKSRGIIGGADEFDASFFGFTPRDAELIDPQHRVFLECAWHALEDGGYVPGQTEARIAVFGGVGTNWHLGDASRHPDVKKFASAASVVVSNDKDYLTTRVSYKLDLTGPSVNVQSACSTSLVATSLGVNSLLAYQCDLALAGGATIEIPEKKGYLYQEGGMESPDGHCRPFDANAKGTVFSRGAGVVLLKRLDDAIRDRDNIYAVILAGATNNDGSLKAGFTAPSVKGQVEVAVEALEGAGVSADSLSFVEAHGTATPVGDPIEVASLTQVFRNYTERKQFCALGSVKGNIGHTDVASGAAGLIKTALALKFGKLPASLNFASPNPQIDFPNSPFFVNTVWRDLPRNGAPLRALINSFGVGGTNACLVLEEPPMAVAAARRTGNVLLLSAKTETALDALTATIKSHIEHHPDLDTNDLAYTSQVGRKPFSHRRYVGFVGREDLLSRLGNKAEGGMNHSVAGPGNLPVVFGFPGQGNQFVGMGADLYRTEPVYRDAVDECAQVLGPLLGLDLRDVMFARGFPAGSAAQLLNQTYITQPALFVTSFAMAKLWMSWGIQPSAMIGHSVGEYVAACLAGVFSLADALTAVARRGQLIQALPGGSMLAVLVPEKLVAPFLTGGIAVAAVNGPQLTVVAGPTTEIAALEERLQHEKIFSKRLDTSHAFHSSMMDPVLPEFAKTLETMRLSAPSVRIASTVTGQWLTSEEATHPDYWVQHVRRPVRFSDAFQTLIADATPCIFIECGPGHSLASAAKHHLNASSPQIVIGSMRAPTDPGSDIDAAMNAVGSIWAVGGAIGWNAFYGAGQPRRVSMPGYPFERQKFALDFSKIQSASPAPVAEGKKPDIGEWFYLPSWKRTSNADLLGARPTGAISNGPQCWLLFDDKLGLADHVADLLEATGNEVIRVRAGREFVRLDEHRFVIRPGAKADYAELLSALKGAGLKPRRVVHLWNLDSTSGPPSIADADRVTSLAFYSPLYLQQAFITQNLIEDLRFIVVANGVFDVAGEGVQCPAKALGLGPCRVIGKELPMVRARFVDVAVPADALSARALAKSLILETQLETEETVAAYRHGYRWTEIFERVYLNASPGLESQLRDGGVYLITGGVSGLGLFFAQQIAKSVRASLILTYRSPLPERTEWQSWLDDHPGDNATSRKLGALLDLEAAGAQVMALQGDVADRDAMEQVVRAAEERFGRINGVIHSAGLAGGGVISLKTFEMAEDVLDAKVKGTLVLDELFHGSDVDFLLLFSSVTSILGEAGRVDYCAGNCFMDAMANYRTVDGKDRVRSINWGPWGEFGMAARWEETKAQRATVRMKAISAADGNRLQLVGRDATQELYDVRLDPDADWFINSHFVFGLPTVVGTTFPELIYEFALMNRPGCVPVIENAYFMSPLMFEPGSTKRLRLFIREQQGRFRFSFKSQLTERDASQDVWQEHFMGEVRFDGMADVAAVDMPELFDRFTRGIDYRPFHVNEPDDKAPVLVLGERWDIRTEVRLGDGEWLARVELPERFTEDLERHAFHPAITDVALASTIDLLSSVYLPSGYKRIQFSRRYPRTVWSHIRLSGPYAPGAETVAFDVRILDDEGNELATIERYTMKKVSAARPAATTTKRVADKLAARPKDILPDEGASALDRILSAPFLPQVIVSTSDFYKLIEEEKPAAKAVESTEEAGAAKPAAGYSRPSLSTPYEEPANEVEKAIAAIWQGILGIDRIGANDDFTELGGNSLLVVQTVANTADTFQIDLPMEAFYQNPTVRSLADVVVERLVSMASTDTLEGLVSSLEGTYVGPS